AQPTARSPGARLRIRRRSPSDTTVVRLASRKTDSSAETPSLSRYTALRPAWRTTAPGTCCKCGTLDRTCGSHLRYLLTTLTRSPCGGLTSPTGGGPVTTC